MTTVVTSVEELADYIDTVVGQILDQAGNLTPWVREQFDDLQTLHAQYFDAEVDPLGIAWAPLAPATVAQKGFDEILIETGRLKASLAGATGDSVRYHVRHMPRQTDMIYGTVVDYARYHQHGTNRIPARPFVGINEPVADAMGNRLADYIVAALSDSLGE